MNEYYVGYFRGLKSILFCEYILAKLYFKNQLNSSMFY